VTRQPEGTDRDTLAGSQQPLGFILGAAARKLAKFYVAALDGEPVTPSQLFFLRQLWLEDGLSLVVVRERAQLDATSATWLADQLEKASLVERRRNDADRRLVRIWLTPAGRDLRDRLEPSIARWETSLRDALAEHHDRQAIAAFEAVLATLIAVLPEGDDLWAEFSTSWDTTLDALRAFIEAQERAGET
jgi:MarR family transcriptional regulator, organic hydroperoxide resistance regulator